MMESSLCICPIGLSHLPITVDAGGDLLSAGHSVASRQKAPAADALHTLLVEDFLDVIYNLGHGVSAVQQLSDAVLHDLPQQVDLFGVGELLHIAQIDGLLVDGQAVKAGTADLCPISQALGGAQFPVKIRLRGLLGGLLGKWKAAASFLANSVMSMGAYCFI